MKLMKSFVLMCCIAVANGVPLTSLNVEETQELLRDWDLHDALGAEFRELHYDGRFLSVLDMGDYSENKFPSANRVHWKVLLREIKREINLRQNEHSLGRRLKNEGRRLKNEGRRLNNEPNTKSFLGVRITNDKSLVSFGKNEDVKLVRTGPKRLSVLADNVNFAAGISAKKIALNGVDLTKLLGQGGGGCSGGNTGSGGGGSKKKPDWVYFATDLGGICEEEETIIETAKECSDAFTMIRKSWKPTVTAGTKQGKNALDMHKNDKGWDAYPAGCMYHNSKGGGLHLSTASKTNARKADTYSICRRDKNRYKYYVTKLGGVCPESDLIEFSMLCSEAYKAVRKSWKPTVLTGKQGSNYLEMHKNENGWSAYPAGCMYHNSKGGGLHLSTASKTNAAKADTYSICQRDLSKPAPVVSYYATPLGKTCPSSGLINTAKECAAAYAAARKNWQPTVLNGKQGGASLDMHKNDKGWDAYPAGCMYHNSKGGGLHVSTASKTNKAKSDTYAICKSVVTPSLSLDQTKDYYATKLGGVCPSHEVINTPSECAMAYQSARRTWQPTIMTGKQGTSALDMHKNDKGWDSYPAGCMYHNSKGGGLHVSTNSKTNRAKSDTYAICKRDIPGAGQIKALAAYVKALEKKVDALAQRSFQCATAPKKEDPCAKNNGGCDKARKCTNVKGKATCGNCPKGFTNSGPTKCKRTCSAKGFVLVASNSVCGGGDKYLGKPAKHRPDLCYQKVKADKGCGKYFTYDMGGSAGGNCYCQTLKGKDPQCSKKAKSNYYSTYHACSA